MADDTTIQFGPFRLHPTQGLARGSQEIRVTAKSLSVLGILASRAGEIVTKEEIFAAAWPDTAVSDAALTSCIKELRQALRDDARQPRYIETVHRRGYRFIGCGARQQPTDEVAAHHVTTGEPIVGRATALQNLHAALDAASGGTRQFVFVTGEAGIGKTTLVDQFVSAARATGAVRVGVGVCAEHHGQGEAYQPLLEALTRLARDSGGDDLAETLARYAPTWLSQLPALQPHQTRDGPVPLATPERMVRELADALDVFTVHVPLIVWLEDLHWSDSSTIEWIAAAARRRERARLLVIATSRPADAARAGISLAALIDTLRVKGLCREIALRGLDEAAVIEYLVLRFPSSPGRTKDFEHVGRLLHRQTQGNPLFVGHVLAALHARDWFVETPRGWEVRGPMDSGDLGIPDDLRRMIERDIERLPQVERELLEVACVTGATFSAAAVSAATAAPLTDVEATFGSLARRHQFVREAGAAEWPDGTIAAQFDFVHSLHRDVLYQQLTAGRRAALHRTVGAAQESAYGTHADAIAAELAMHFDRGFDHGRAIVHLHVAAETARRRSAYREAQLHLERALTLLDKQPPGSSRDEREITLRIGLGSILQVVRGWGAREVEDAFARARELCEQLGDKPRLFPALWGLWLFYWGRSSLDAAGTLAAQLQTLARQAEDRALELQAHHACWATNFSLGHLREAQSHAERGLALYDASRHAGMASTYGNHDAAVCGAAFSARALTLMGREEEAVRTCEWAIAHARHLAHPVTLCHSLTFAAWVHHLRRNSAAAADCAEAAGEIARDQSLRLLLAWASVSSGWAGVQQGLIETGLARIREAIADVEAMGSLQFVTHLLGLLAEACLYTGDRDGGLNAVERALGHVESSGERFYEAELHRLKGELLLAQPDTDFVRHEAESAFQRALTIARSQGAALLEARAADSLARIVGQAGPSLDAPA